MKKFLIGLFLAITMIAYTFYFKSKEETLPVFKGTENTSEYTAKIGNFLSDKDKNKAYQIVNKAFNSLHSMNDEISELNKLAAFTAVSISEELERLFLTIDRLFYLTHGLFDPTINPALQQWKALLQKNAYPTKEEADAIKTFVGWRKVHFRGRVFYKEIGGLQLSIGGIIKGYILEMLAQNLLDDGIENFFLEWDNVTVAHGKNEGNPWTVLVEDALRELNDNALARSKDTQNWKVQECKKGFCSVTNPTKWRPMERSKNSICKASVQLSNAALADGLAYTLMLPMTRQEALTLTAGIKKELDEGEFWMDSCD